MSAGTPVAVAVLAAGALLTGCAELPQPRPPAVQGLPPVVVPGQAGRILSATWGTLRASDATYDGARLATRVGGPELTVQQARYAIGRKTAPRPAGSAAGGPDLDPLQLYVPRQGPFPHFFLVATRVGRDALPRLLVLRSATAREPYRLWARPALLPGATLPRAAAPRTGVPALPADATGYTATPAQVVDRYADLLTNGAGSRFATQFAPDAFRDAVLLRQSNDARSAAPVADARHAHTPIKDATTSIGTVDAALVVTAYTGTTELTVRPGAGSITAGANPSLEHLAGRRDYPARMTVGYTETVVFVVPRQVGRQIRVVAADVALTSVDGD